MSKNQKFSTYTDIIRSQLEDQDVVEELQKAESNLRQNYSGFETDFSESLSSTPAASTTDAIASLRGRPNLERPMTFTEAIVVREGYPVLLVKNNKYVEPKLPIWKQRLTPHRARINRCLGAVGRIEFTGHSQLNWGGTGWRIDEDTIITNRHVANLFSDIRRQGFPIKKSMRVRIDFREEHNTGGIAEFPIDKVKFVELFEPDIDLAFLRLERGALNNLNADPLSIKDDLGDVEFVGVIGYPAFDSRNSAADQSRIFDDIFDVKRLAPGKIIDLLAGRDAFQHNSTTLGGVSGGAVIDIATGCAVGLHFGGREGIANYSVKPKSILDRATKNNVRVRLCGDGGPGNGAAVDADASGGGGLETPIGGKPETYSDRDGFNPLFLGKADLAVPLPKLNAIQQRDAAPVDGGGFELKYRHFSAVMNGKRRLAYYTACNIDGSKLWAFNRGRDKWVIDSRVNEEHQVDNVLYKGRRNDFDRGHLVRRLDPVWGDEETATQAMEDTFHYTNAAPQHKNLNRRIWLGLETHILDNTDERDWKISVLAGPIFGQNDPVHKPTQLPVPRAFWKVVASVVRKRRRKPALQAQAFVLWQDHLIDDDDLEAIFGVGFETHQVSVAELERLAGLDFQNLVAADTFGRPPDVHDISEAVASGDLSSDTNYESITDFDQIVMA